MPRIGVAGRVRSSGPASARSFSTSRLNLVLTRGLLFFPPVYRDGVHLYCQPLSGSPELILSVWQLRTDGVHCLEYTGTGPVVLAVACLRNMGCLFWYLHGPNSYFLTPTIIGTMNMSCAMYIYAYTSKLAAGSLKRDWICCRALGLGHSTPYSVNGVTHYEPSLGRFQPISRAVWIVGLVKRTCRSIYPMFCIRPHPVIVGT